LKIRLFFKAVAKFVLGAVLVGALIFLPAGSFAFPQPWLLLGVLFVPMFLAGVVMTVRAPALLEKRLNAKEKEGAQKTVLLLSALMFVAAFVIAGLNLRFGRLVLPMWVSLAAAAVFLLAYVLYAEVLRENAWLSRTVGVQEGQEVVSTGLYGVVRHPMYTATLLLFLSMPLILGSPVSFAVMLCYIPIIAARIRNEEKVLEEGLEGYAEYRRRVRWRLVPYLW
jgi:protein-S-isoprenylcysteine O-methyltransferase Ste14